MGWNISNTGIKFVLSKHSGTEKGCIVFDTIDPSTSGLVMMVKKGPLPPKYDNQPIRQIINRRVTELALDMRQVGLLPRADLIPLTFNPFEIAQSTTTNGKKVSMNGTKPNNQQKLTTVNRKMMTNRDLLN
jgi:hypothetical protein